MECYTPATMLQHASRTAEAAEVSISIRSSHTTRFWCEKMFHLLLQHLFERSEFLIATSKKKKCACVRVSCVRLILVLVGGKIIGFSMYLYVLCTTYVCMYLVSAGYPYTYMIPGTYCVPDTYVPGQIRMYLLSAGYPDTYVPGISRQTNVPPVDAHVWRQLHVSAVARCSDSYCRSNYNQYLVYNIRVYTRK